MDASIIKSRLLRRWIGLSWPWRNAYCIEIQQTARFQDKKSNVRLETSTRHSENHPWRPWPLACHICQRGLDTCGECRLAHIFHNPGETEPSWWFFGLAAQFWFPRHLYWVAWGVKSIVTVGTFPRLPSTHCFPLLIQMWSQTQGRVKIHWEIVFSWSIL